jgi:hypothetical protein
MIGHSRFAALKRRPTLQRRPLDQEVRQQLLEETAAEKAGSQTRKQYLAVGTKQAINF